MITKRLLRVSLGPTFLEDDKESDVLSGPAQLNRIVDSGLHDSQLQILKSLGLITNKQLLTQSSFLLRRLHDSSTSSANEPNVVSAREFIFHLLIGSSLLMQSFTAALLCDVTRRIQTFRYNSASYWEIFHSTVIQKPLSYLVCEAFSSLIYDMDILPEIHDFSSLPAASWSISKFFMRYTYCYPALEVSRGLSLQILPLRDIFSRLLPYSPARFIPNLRKNYGFWLLRSAASLRWSLIFFSFPQETPIFAVNGFHMRLIDGLITDTITILIDQVVDRGIARELNTDMEVYNTFELGSLKLLASSLIVEWTMQFVMSQILQCGLYFLKTLKTPASKKNISDSSS